MNEPWEATTLPRGTMRFMRRLTDVTENRSLTAMLFASVVPQTTIHDRPAPVAPVALNKPAITLTESAESLRGASCQTVPVISVT